MVQSYLILSLCALLTAKNEAKWASEFFLPSLILLVNIFSARFIFTVLQFLKRSEYYNSVLGRRVLYNNNNNVIITHCHNIII